MGGEHRLVGGDDRQTARQRGLDRLEGDPVRPADQFDEDIDVGGRRQRRRVLIKNSAAEIDAALARLARAIGGKHAVAAGPRGKPGPLAMQQPHQARPDDAETRDAETERLGHDPLAPLVRGCAPVEPASPSPGPHKRGRVRRLERSAVALGGGLFLALALLAGRVAGVTFELALIFGRFGLLAQTLGFGLVGKRLKPELLLTGGLLGGPPRGFHDRLLRLALGPLGVAHQPRLQNRLAPGLALDHRGIVRVIFGIGEKFLRHGLARLGGGGLAVGEAVAVQKRHCIPRLLIVGDAC